MSLELRVSAALLRARIAERALHDRSAPWSLEVAGHRVAAERTFGEDRIVFTAVMRAPVPGRAHQVLRCGEDIVDVAELLVPVTPGCGEDDRIELRHEIVVGVA